MWKSTLYKAIISLTMGLLMGFTGFALGFQFNSPASTADVVININPPATYYPAISMTTIEAKRQQVIDYLFGGSLPATLPLRDGERLAIDLPYGFQSQARLLFPDQLSDTLVIYHAGHGGNQQERDITPALLSAGYTVVVMDMPLHGMNEGVVTVELDGSILPISSHDHLAYLTRGMAIFVEPVIAVVNWAVTQGYQDIYMIGLSGGGWTTIMAAAVDSRIDASYPVAGSVPLGLRFDNPNGWGDWEQVAPEFYQAVATYEELYILGSYARRQMQVLNDNDPCCFADPRYVHYEQAVRAFLGISGEFSVLWDDNDTHSISDAALQAILADIGQDLIDG